MTSDHQFQRQSDHLKDDYIPSVSNKDDRGYKQALLSMKLAMETMCNAMVHFGEHLQWQEDAMKTSNECIIDTSQLIAANIRRDDSTHRFRRADAQHVSDNVCQQTTSIGYHSAPLRNVVDQSVQFNITPNKPIVSLVSFPPADLKLSACKPMTCYPVSAVNAPVVTPKVVPPVTPSVVATLPVSVVTCVHCGHAVTSAITKSASAAHCIMNTNTNRPITSDKTVSSASKRKERKVSDYNCELDVDANLEQFDLVATYNGR